MTAQFEAFTQPVKQEKPAKQPADQEFTWTIVVLLTVTAVVSWLGGVAIYKGFGGHAPFIATWVLLLTALLTIRTITYQVAGAWFNTQMRASALTFASQAAMRDAEIARLAKQFTDGLTGGE